MKKYNINVVEMENVYKCKKMYINVVIGTGIYIYLHLYTFFYINLHLFTKIYFLFVHIRRHNF